PGCPVYTMRPTKEFNSLVWFNVFLGPFGLGTALIDVVSGASSQIKEVRVGALCVNGVVHPLRTVAVGMTESQVRLSWGYPRSTTRVETARGPEARWVYDEGNVYMRNGVVTAVELIGPVQP
ncbi:MAG TPA: hypothetical protein VNP72_10600, partial [Longimicrobium sp.]|nr:hypothetical protein [Longimicrobium sp.]